jgi:hypothetical protein
MERDGHGLPKVSPGPTMPYPATPSGRATPKMVLQPFQGWPPCKAGGLRPSSTPLDTPRRTPMLKIAVQGVDAHLSRLVGQRVLQLEFARRYARPLPPALLLFFPAEVSNSIPGLGG